MTDLSNDTQIIQFTNDELSFPKQFLTAFRDNTYLSLRALKPKNRAEYKATYQKWRMYSLKRDNKPFNLEAMLVSAFLSENNWSYNTRSVRLAHLRKYAKILALTDDNNDYGYAHNFERLQLITPKSLGGEKYVSTPVILSRRQIYTIFDSWEGDDNKNTRNRAILGLMLLAGLRSSEIVALLWSDVHFSKEQIFVRDGKGDKSKFVPMLGDLNRLLSEWNTLQNITKDYTFVCVQVFRSDKIGKDEAVTTHTVSKLCKDTFELCGIEFRPHDARRTVITELINTGASVAQAQSFARHSSGATTLLYAEESDTTALGKSLSDKLPYGDVLSARGHTDKGRNFECGFGHIFVAINPLECPVCGSIELSHQISMFDDVGKK